MQKDDVIYRQAAIDLFPNDDLEWDTKDGYVAPHLARRMIEELPSAQSDIIRCNACKHWTQTTGNMPGFGLGDCDYLNAKLVNCNGYCYWAERRED